MSRLSDLDVIQFAKASARDAADHIGATNRDGSPLYADPVMSFRENLTDTMNDAGTDGLAQSAAFEMYDAECKRLGLI